MARFMTDQVGFFAFGLPLIWDLQIAIGALLGSCSSG